MEVLMDIFLRRDREFAVDIECGMITGDEVGSPDHGSSDSWVETFFTRLFRGITNVDFSFKYEKLVKLNNVDSSNSNEVSPENLKLLFEKKTEGNKSLDLTEKKLGREQRKKTSAKKPPKPPRPPRGLSLDAADQKLIKEIAELAMLKRARIERMKALKKMKAAKASSSSIGSLFAMLFTILFCIVILFQGMSSGSSSVSFQGSQVAPLAKEGAIISVQDQLNPSASDSNSPGFKSLNLLEQVSGSDPTGKAS